MTIENDTALAVAMAKIQVSLEDLSREVSILREAMNGSEGMIARVRVLEKIDRPQAMSVVKSTGIVGIIVAAITGALKFMSTGTSY